MPAVSDVDLLSPEAVHDPHDAFARLRQLGPAVWLERHRAWLLLSHELVQEGIGDARLSTDNITPLQRHMDDEQRARFEPARQLLESWMIFNDPPVHTALREPVRAAFTPRSVARLEEEIERRTHAILDGVGGTVDVVRDLAYPLPATVIAVLLGVPEERHRDFEAWSHQLGSLVMGKVERQDSWDRALLAAQEFESVFGGLIEHYRSDPADNLISRLVSAADGDAALSPHQLVGACSLLLFGGHETTTSLISSSILALAERPAERARLAAEPALLPEAVEELLRFDGPSKIVVRRVREDGDWHGLPLKAGQPVFCAIAAANRDPVAFDDPDELRLDRTPNRHLSFGWSRHFCLGAQLARLEARVIIGAVVGRFPELRIACSKDELRYYPTVVGRTLERLPVELG